MKKKTIKIKVVERIMCKAIRMSADDAYIFDRIAAEKGLAAAYRRWLKKYGGQRDDIWRERHSVSEQAGPINFLVDL